MNFRFRELIEENTYLDEKNTTTLELEDPMTFSI
jgi:hypothetical protein